MPIFKMDRDAHLIYEAFDMSRRTFLKGLAKASAALKAGVANITDVDVPKVKPLFKSMTIVSDPHEFWGTGDFAGGDIAEVFMDGDTSGDVLSQVNKSSRLLDFGDGVIVDVDNSTPYDFKVHVDMNSPFGSLLHRLPDEYQQSDNGSDWGFDWGSSESMRNAEWHEHPVLGPLYKKIGMTLYNDPEWLADQMNTHLHYKQGIGKKVSKGDDVASHVTAQAKMSDAEYMETEILPDYNRMYREVTLEDLPKETMTAVLSQYSTAIPAGPPPKQAELNFDDEETALKRKIEETEKALADPDLQYYVRHRDTEHVHKQAMLENRLEQLKIEYNKKFGKEEYEAPDTSTMDSEGGGQAQHFENFRMNNDDQLIWEAYDGQRPPADRIKDIYMYNVNQIKDGQWPHSPAGHDPAEWAVKQLDRMFKNLIKFYIDLDPAGPSYAPSDEEYVHDVSASFRHTLAKLHIQLNAWEGSGSMEHLDIETLEELQDLFENIWDIYERQSPEGRPGIDDHI